MTRLQPPIALCIQDKDGSPNGRASTARRDTIMSTESTSTQQTQFEGVGQNLDGSDSQHHVGVNLNKLFELADVNNDGQIGSHHVQPHNTLTSAECDSFIQNLDAVKAQLLKWKEQADQDDQQSHSRLTGETVVQESTFDSPSSYHTASELPRPRSRPVVSEPAKESKTDETRRPSYADILLGKKLNDAAETSTEPIPRFAQPTAATARRTNETQRKQTATTSAIVDKSPAKTTMSRAASISPSKRTVSKLPRRNGLPFAWTAIGSAKDGEDYRMLPSRQKSLSKTSPKRSDLPAYQLPTKATLQRELDTQRPDASNKSPKTKQKSRTGNDDALNAMGVAIARISEVSRRMSALMNLKDASNTVENTTLIRRESNGSILTPIREKLTVQGLLRDETTKYKVPTETDEGMPSRKNYQRSSYADILRRSSSQLGARGQSSAEIGRAIAQSQACDSDAYRPLKRFDSISLDIDRVIIPSGSSYTHVESIEPLDETASTNSTLAALDSRSAMPSMESSAPIGEPVYRTQSWPWNVDAEVFEPRDKKGTSTPVTLAPSVKAIPQINDDDVFRTIPESEWSTMSPEERQLVRFRRRQRLMRYFTPLAWQKHIMCPKVLRHRVDVQAPIYHSPMTGSSNSTWSPVDVDSRFGRPRRGWKIDAGNFHGPHWSGGNGREIRFLGHGARAEQRLEDHYIYKNRDTGAMAYLDNWLESDISNDNIENIDRLQAAILRGYPKVPCGSYGYDSEAFAVVPGPCHQCNVGQPHAVVY